MKPSLILLFIAWLFSFSGNTQTVDYHLVDEFPKVRTEKIEPDGSIWYSYVKQDTFHLDSISPAGQIYGKTIIPLQLDTQQFVTTYLLHPEKGLVITIHQQDLIFESGHIAVQLYNLNGVLQWESEFTPLQEDFTYSYYPAVLNDSLFLYGYSQHEGDDNYHQIGLFNLTWNGDSIAFKWIGSCGIGIQTTPLAAYFMHYGGCSANGFGAPTVVKKYNTDFQLLETITFMDSTNSTVNNPIYGVVGRIDDSTYVGTTVDETGFKINNCVVKIGNGNQEYLSLSNRIPGFNDSNMLDAQIYGVNKLDSGFLFLTVLTRMDTMSIRHHIIELAWINKNLNNSVLLYQDTLPTILNFSNISSTESANEISIYLGYGNTTLTPFRNHLKLTINKTITSLTPPIHSENNFSFYPNPANQSIYISSEYAGTLELYDLTGRIITTIHVENINTKIDVSTFKNGLYILKFTTENGVSQTEKLIISK